MALADRGVFGGPVVDAVIIDEPRRPLPPTGAEIALLACCMVEWLLGGE